LAVDYYEGPILRALARFRRQSPGSAAADFLRTFASLLRDLRRGDYDLVVAASDTEQPENPNRRWLEPSGWGAASAAVAQGEGPVPLLVVGENSLSRRLSVSALERAGQDYQIVYVAGSFAGLVQARRRGSASPDGAALPDRGGAAGARRPAASAAVSDVYWRIYLREDLDLPRSRRSPTAIMAARRRGGRCRPPRSRSGRPRTADLVFSESAFRPAAAWTTETKSGLRGRRETCPASSAGPGFSASCLSCAKPERCASRSCAASSICHQGLLTMPSTASAEQGRAKISGHPGQLRLRLQHQVADAVFDATLSEITAPTKARVIATLSEPKKYGKARGIPTLRMMSTWRRRAP
jgi:hypothetical protein